MACFTATLSLRPFTTESFRATDPTPTCYPTQIVDGVAVEYATALKWAIRQDNYQISPEPCKQYSMPIFRHRSSSQTNAHPFMWQQ
ncbi:hypothetical protein Y032_0068g144 [Ancylostoma ceylanicum]|uniref:Uncharacterized protein n=1 Tax=Ancylostoma ceylanicum TaxID=53326 RepID=A0A016TYX4_9BILA|nr:hypothetical protein Y032_0068g144 [Ancylostoma ceylanicum]